MMALESQYMCGRGNTKLLNVALSKQYHDVTAHYLKKWWPATLSVRPSELTAVLHSRVPLIGLRPSYQATLFQGLASAGGGAAKRDARRASPLPSTILPSFHFG